MKGSACGTHLILSTRIEQKYQILKKEVLEILDGDQMEVRIC